MSSESQTLAFVQLSNYGLAILVTAVIYDYLHTLPREIDYIWKPWTWVSTLFVIVRYIGLFHVFLVASGIVKSMIKVAGLERVYRVLRLLLSIGQSVCICIICPTLSEELKRTDVRFKGTAIALMSEWTLMLFFVTSNLVMLLHVYAMWRQSKLILGILLFLYIPQVIITFVLGGISTTPGPYFSMHIVQMQGTPICQLTYTSPSPTWTYTILDFTLGSAMLILAIVQTLKQSFSVYEGKKVWEPSRYIKLLVREGIVYFLLHVLYDIQSVVTGSGTVFRKWMIIVATLAEIFLFAVLPRFFINIRELYARDGSCEIDTEHGISSQAASGQLRSVATIVFADGDEGADGPEAGENELGGTSPGRYRLDEV